ncbi:MAG: MlaE family lipid ABC transporter permease subunit [Legionellaceae bacterium]
MTQAVINPQWTFDKKNNHFLCEGHWATLSLSNLPLIEHPLTNSTTVTIDGSKLTAFDSAGAVVLYEQIYALKKHHTQVNLVHFNEEELALIALVEKNKDNLHPLPSPKKNDPFLVMIGKETINKISQVDGLIMLIGDLTDKLFIGFTQWRRFQVPSIVANIDSTGIKALPILALLSFLIGVVLAYQMGLQLETYGASSFIAYLSGMAIFREFAPLITAIIVAGRTSSAFTAQIGSMKINEEIDALHTMGLSPTELLVIPKVLALLIVFPLIIFWSDIFSTLGAMIMSKFMLHVGYIDFLTRLQESVGFKQLMLGLYKAPAFAFLIALVGCFQGFKVELNADSVGSQTTKSVVQALFLIIITDATYSIIYSWLDL